MKQDTIHFNSELLFGEIGAIIGAPLFAYLASLVRDAPHFISFFGVVGAVTGSSLLWLTFRVRNAKKRGDYTHGKLFSDIIHYTPFATVVGLLVYQPLFFLLSSHLIENGMQVIYSVIIGQVVGFFTFAIILNIYRSTLEKTTGKRL